MENIVIAFNAVMPLICLMGIGYLVKFYHLIGESSIKEVNKVIFMVLMPLMLMNNVAHSDLKTTFNLPLLLTVNAIILIVIILLWLLVPLFVQDKQKIGVIIQGVYRGNFLLIGLAVIQNIYGVNALAKTPMIIATIVPLYNLSAVIILQHYANVKCNRRQTVINIFKNPLIIGIIFGFVLLFAQPRFPRFIEATLTSIDQLTLPLALIILGASLEWKKIKDNQAILTFMTLGKLVFLPLIGVTIGVLLNFRQEELIIILMVFAGPTAISSYPMAESMGLDGKLAAQGIVLSALFVLVTLFIWIYIIGMLGYL